MKQIVRRGVIIGKHGNILIRYLCIIERRRQIIQRIGKEVSAQGSSSLGDLPDLKPLALLGSNDNNVLQGIEAPIPCP